MDKIRRWLRLGVSKTPREEPAPPPATRSLPLAGRTPPPVPDDIESPPLGRGSRLGRYRILAALGAGGTANVYAAYDEQLERRVALKILRGARQRTAAQRELLLHEAKAAARLTHPNVITVYDVGTADGLPFVSMELIEGETLDEWARRGDRSWRQRLAVLCDAGRGLAAAHRAGLVHRDFKPSNAMVAKDGRVLVLDFGLALEAGRDPTGGESPVGTPGFIAPEQLAGAAGDARGDQFAFCTTAWRILYGRLPAADGGESQDAGARRDRRVPSAVRQILEKGLAADPAARHADMTTLLDALQAVVRRAARGRKTWIAACAVVAVVCAGTYLGLQQPGALCQGSAERLATAWNPHIAAQAAARFASLGVDAGTTWPRVQSRLSAYADRWIEIHRGACEATHLRGEQSEQLLDRQMACLDDRRQDLAAVTQLLRSAEADWVDQAVPVAESLASLEPCAQRSALLAQPAPPDDPAVAEQVLATRFKISRAKALESAGRYREAIAEAKLAHRRADEIGYVPLEVDALLRVAQAVARVGHYPQMKQNLIAAAELAQSVGYDRGTAFCFAALVLASAQTGDMEGARAWGRMASGIIQRLEEPTEVQHVLSTFLAILAEMEGRYDDALGHLRTNLASIERSQIDRRSIRRGYAHFYIGRTLFRLRRFDEAEKELKRSRVILTEAFGPRHRAVVRLVNVVGELHLAKGEPGAAAERFREAIELLEGGGEEEDWDTADALDGLAEAELAMGRPKSARSALERSLELRTERPGRPYYLARTRFLLARSLWSLGDRHRSRELAQAVHREPAEETPEAAALHAAVSHWLAEREGGAPPRMSVRGTG